MITSKAPTQLNAKSLGKDKIAGGQGLWIVNGPKDARELIPRIVIGRRRRELEISHWPDTARNYPVISDDLELMTDEANPRRAGISLVLQSLEP